MNKYAFVLVVKYNPLRIDMTSHFNETEKRTVYSSWKKSISCNPLFSDDMLQIDL